ncbi:hypothetical protein [Scytonema sp. PCC 10023]|uniref:hypothetical protein n=1 Tax=Scytonema sp. PCC 10023 TaxID=1680591 RepID=UPI0039C6F7E3
MALTSGSINCLHLFVITIAIAQMVIAVFWEIGDHSFHTSAITTLSSSTNAIALSVSPFTV